MTQVDPGSLQKKVFFFFGKAYVSIFQPFLFFFFFLLLFLLSLLLLLLLFIIILFKGHYTFPETNNQSAF